jgi:uncharacterized membrane protein YgcG
MPPPSAAPLAPQPPPAQTALPYMSLAAAVAWLFGSVPVALGWYSPPAALLVCLAVMAGALRVFGRRPEDEALVLALADAAADDAAGVREAGEAGTGAGGVGGGGAKHRTGFSSDDLG